jgi:hypothetical protein
MRLLRQTLAGLRGLLYRPKVEAGLDEELCQYLELAVAEKMKAE